jgi:hypothetical protein
MRKKKAEERETWETWVGRPEWNLFQSTSHRQPANNTFGTCAFFFPPSYLDNNKFIIIIFFWLLVDYILSLLFGLLVCNKRKKKTGRRTPGRKRKKITEIRSKCF